MAGQLTKKDLEEILDKKFDEYQAVIVEAVDFKFQKIDQRIDSFDGKMGGLIDTLNAFLERLSEQEDKVLNLRAEVDMIKSVLKDKLDVEIA